MAVVATIRESEATDKLTSEQSSRTQRIIDTKLAAMEKGMRVW